MTKSNYQSVKEFHSAFNIKMPDKPTPLSAEEMVNRTGFIAEELIEALHSSSDSEEQFRKLCLQWSERVEEAFKKQLTKKYPKTDKEKLIGQVDACLDVRYYNSGDFTLLAVDPDPLFEVIQDCNMKKLFPDGKPRYNEHGKIIKPDGWQPPEERLEQEIDRQLNQ